MYIYIYIYKKIYKFGPVLQDSSSQPLMLVDAYDDAYPVGFSLFLIITVTFKLSFNMRDYPAYTARGNLSL